MAEGSKREISPIPTPSAAGPPCRARTERARRVGRGAGVWVPCALALLAANGCREGVLESVNHAPIVQSVVATPQTVFTGQQVVLRAEATDEDGDGIRYFWAAEDGAFDVVIGEAVQWTAPAFAGDYRIQVNASDRVASTSANVRVRVQP